MLSIYLLVTTEIFPDSIDSYRARSFCTGISRKFLGTSIRWSEEVALFL